MATEIHTETVTYSAGSATLRGYRATPAGADHAPAVLVIHEWWGLNDYVRGRADQLARLGYVAFAPDMYGDGRTAGSPAEASALMNGVLSDIPAATERLRAAYEQAKASPGVDPARVAAIGYCFGGAMVLHAARIGLPLAGVVSFHGALGSAHTPAPGSVKAKVLVLHGAADALVPEADVAAFKQEMEAAGADYEFIAYAGALHGFTNPDATAKGQQYGLPLAYDKATDERSWHDMLHFFERIFA
jgi:dienelactone hydrolase